MDDEQRERMRDLKRSARREVLIGGTLLGLAIVAGLLFDDWTTFLVAGSSSLVLTAVVFLSQWRYLRRGPFPRLPASLRDGTAPDSTK